MAYRGGKPPVAHVFPRRHDREDLSAAFRRANQRHSREAIWPVAEKGRLAPGADGDVVIIDPQRTTTIRHEMLHDNADYSPWEGFICQGAIRQTLSHGRVIFDNGTFTGSAGQGRFLRRDPFLPLTFRLAESHLK